MTLRDHPILRMLNSAWKKARQRAGLSNVRVHDLKHTFGRRLRAAGVSFEDRQDLLGHKSARITTHYSAAEICNLLEAANRVCRKSHSTPILTILRHRKYDSVSKNVAPFIRNVTVTKIGNISTLAHNEAHEESCEIPARLLEGKEKNFVTHCVLTDT